ncbi:MAG: hypothetical protein JXA50_06820 [Deltaproteobacteria bacterium]|nr:hypothetical protein [Deltaproteobacteria bacterium]
MSDSNEWGNDQSVQIMRKVFKEIETAQYEFLRQLDVPPYDHRLQGWRERALALFEKGWSIAHRRGVIFDEKIASAFYIHCLAKVIGSEGNTITENMLPKIEGLEKLFTEILS